MEVGKSSATGYRFLPGLEPTYNKEIRAFVLRRHMMKRKNRALARIGSKYKGFKDDPEAGPADIGQSSSRATDSGDGQAGGVHDGCTALVSTRLGMGRVDPFQTYARDTNNFENAMIDEYLMHWYTWFGLKRRRSFCPSRDLMFPDNIQDDLTVLAMITYGASTHEQRRGALPKYSTIYRALIIRSLNDRLQREYECPGDALLNAVCGLICTTTETRSKGATSQEVAEMMAHAHGLRAMIAARGGWSSFRPSLQCLFYLVIWVDIVLNGAISAGSTVLSQHIYSAPSQFHRQPKLPYQAKNPKIYYPEELIGAYADFYHAALNRRRNHAHSPTRPPHRSPRDLFQPAAPSYRLLCSMESLHLRRIVPLVYINLMIWNYRNCSRETLDRLYDCYSKNITASDVDLAGSNEILISVLMTNFDTKKPMHLDWIELMTRIQFVEAKLSTNTQERLANTLLEFIVDAPPTDAIDTAAEWWTPEQFAAVVREELRDAVWTNLLFQESVSTGNESTPEHLAYRLDALRVC